MTDLSPHNALLIKSNRPDVSAGLFGPQRDFVEDASPLVSAVCSRRAGKTWGVTRKMVKVCQNKPNALVGYITKTRDWAEELVWEPLKNIDAGQGGGADFNNAKLRCVFSNGSKIRLAGAKDKAQAEVLRGFGYDLIVIDECGSIDPVIMRYILRDVLPAALGENEGQLLVVGTPNESCSGYFHDVSVKEDSGFSKHHWTQRENVMFPLWVDCKPSERDRLVDEYLTEERRKWGYSETDPEYQREYMGLWAKNEELFIYRITEDNLRRPPDVPLRYVLAIDIGWHDMTAWELVGYDSDSQCMWEVDSTQEQHLTFEDIAARTIQYAKDYELDHIVVDTAGAGKVVQDSLAKEVSLRFEVPCKAAAKNRKGTNMKFLASDLRKGTAFLLPDSVCADQMKSLKWDKHHLREQEPEPGQFIDNADGYLYAYRECYHWMHEPREVLPEIGTPERSNLDMLRIEEEEAAAFTDPNKRWWE
ncbi:MAG: terminase large subunit domain-containing protein [Candidatus Thorarchaeota archaeon]